MSLCPTADFSGAFRPYKSTATNGALTSWSTLTPLAGIPNTYIDTFIVKIGSTYHAFLKSTQTMSIDFTRASSLTGPYTIWKTGNFVAYDDEGPALVALDNGGWRMFFAGRHLPSCRGCRLWRHRDFELWADLYQDSDIFRADSSFTLANPWA